MDSHFEGWLCFFMALAAVGFAVKQTVDKVKNGIKSVGDAACRAAQSPIAGHAARGAFAMFLHRMLR